MCVSEAGITPERYLLVGKAALRAGAGRRPALQNRALVDENVRIPEWTRKLVAVLKSLNGVGEEVRARTRAAMAEQKASIQ